MNLFSTDKRKKISLEQYWDLCDTYIDGSLQLLVSPDEMQMRNRLNMLIKAEVQFGFVFDAEKIWLEGVLGSSEFESYPDWLLRNINKYLLDEPLLWGVGDGPDIWHASVNNASAKGFSFDVTGDDEIATFSTHFGISVYGTRHRPGAVHLVQAFRQLFNIPYHLLDIKERLLCRPAKIKEGDQPKGGFGEYDWIGIENVVETEPERCLLSLGNHYGSWEGIAFIGRRAQPNSVDNRSVAIAFENSQFDDWRPLDDGKHSAIPPRLVNKYRDHFDSNEIDKHLRPYGKYAYLLQQIICRCGGETEFYFQFKWGQLDNYIEYRVGSDIIWGGTTIGYPELESVYVVANADMHCLNCGHKPCETLIHIRDNRIHSLVPERLANIQYTFKGPFIGEDYVAWEDYQKVWIRREWNKTKAIIERKELDQCVLPDMSNWKTNSVWGENHKYLYLVSKYRCEIDSAFFERCVLQWPVHIYGVADGKIALETKLKSCAILRIVRNSEVTLVKFYWGSLLDFPVYGIGDTIRWSEYSTGDKDIDEVVYARGFVDGNHSIKTIIEIKRNKIVDIYFDRDKPDLDTLSYNDKAHAFYGRGWLPWLVMPDDEYIAFRRPR